MNEWIRAALHGVVGVLLLLWHTSYAMAEQCQGDTAAITQLYHDMYRCMIAKDTAALARMLDDSFVLVHMTGMRQPKEAYLRAIDDGTLNYYSCTETQLELQLHGENAILIGRSRVTAAVFGGGRHTWPLELTLSLSKREGRWVITRISAATFATP